MAYYDYEEDRPLIKGAFCASFGMLPQQFEDLTYTDYLDLFPSINGETTFAAVIRTRMETNRDRIKDFSKSEYAEWIKYQAKKKKFENKLSIQNKAKIEKQKQENSEKLLTARQRLQELMNK